MKRLAILILALILFVPSVVYGEIAMDNHPDDLVGCWAVFIPRNTNGYGDCAIVFILNSDGTMSAMLSTNKSSTNEIICNTAIGKWTFISDTVIYRQDGHDKYGKMEFHDDMIWYSMSGATFGLKKLPLMDITQVNYPDMTEE